MQIAQNFYLVVSQQVKAVLTNYQRVHPIKELK